MIREAIRSTLLANAPLAAMVAGRVYPLKMPQGVREPSLVYQRASGIFDVLLDGPQALRETRIQLDAWALDPDVANAVMRLAEPVLSGFTGRVPVGDDSPQAYCNIKGMFLDNERDGYDQASTLYREGRDFRVLWCPE